MEPLRQSVVVYTSFWQLLRRHWCQTVITSLFIGSNSDVERGACYTGNNRSSIYHRPRIHPNLHRIQTNIYYKLERTLQLRLAVLTQHGEQQLPAISRRAIGVPSGEEILGSHWTAIARLKLASPQYRKMLSCHGLLSSLGARGLGSNRKAARN